MMGSQRTKYPRSRWYKHSVRVITAAIAAGGTPDEQRARVDAAYPYGQRAYLPYKWWLRARTDLFFQHGLETPAQVAAAARRAAAAQREVDECPFLVKASTTPTPDTNQQLIEGII